MSEGQAKDSTWVYWRARALAASGKTDADRAEATRLLQGIASVRGFYEQLALEELGQRITSPPAPTALSPEEKEGARLNPGLQRSLHAIKIGLRTEGVREWNYSTNLHQRGGMGDRELLAAADLACQREVWDRCINTSERTKVEMDFSQRFPMPHKTAVLQRTAQIGLDPAYVYGWCWMTLPAPCPWPQQLTTPGPADPATGAGNPAPQCWRPPSGPKTCRSMKPGITSRRCFPTPPTTPPSSPGSRSL
jgi:soluble lytic murein transglycosylase